MENVKFEIKPSDIQEYLKQHKEDEFIKYREAMFVKYMKESNIITQESLEILMKKYNWDERMIEGTYSVYDERGYIRQLLPSFHSYLDNISNLDISGICHIMIPMLSYYNIDKSRSFSLYAELGDLVRKMEFEHNESINYIEKDTYENYVIAYSRDIFRFFEGTHIYFSQEKSRKIIQEYASIYGEEPVKQIRKIIKKRMDDK